MIAFILYAPHRMAWIATLGLCVSLMVAHPAVAADGRTAALLTYHYDGWDLLPSRCFSGVVMSDQHIVTSAQALRRGHGGPIGEGGGGLPGEVYAVLRRGEEQLVLRCRPIGAGGDSPLAILEVPEIDRPLVRELLGEPPEIAALNARGENRLIAAVSPFGLRPEEFDTETVPAPVEVPLELGGASSLSEGRFDALAVEHPLPPEAVGGGVWDEGDRLVGIVLWEDLAWRVVDAASAREEMDRRASASASGPPEPEGAAPVNTPLPLRADRPPPQIDAALKDLYDMLDASGLTMQIDPGLADYVGREPADRVMMLIAGGRVPDALALLDEVEPGAEGGLAEQLRYRRALALTIEGEYDAATAAARETLDAENEVVRARGRTLFHVLEEHAGGGFRARPLREPAVLVDAIHDYLGRIDERLRLDLAAVQSEVSAGEDDYERIDRRIELIARRVEANEHAWPGYFDDLARRVGAFRERVIRRMYGVLRSAYRAYQLERRRVEHHAEGSDWAEAGYDPPRRVEHANELAERVHNLIGYLDRIGATGRLELPDDLADEVERLPLARPADDS